VDLADHRRSDCIRRPRRGLDQGHYDDRAQARQAEQSRTIAREDQQRQAYGELVKTARLALRNFRQLVLAYAANTPDIPAVQEAFSQTASLAADMNQAAALAELAGSLTGRKHARAIYDKARACADLIQGHELYSAAMVRRLLLAVPDADPGLKPSFASQRSACFTLRAPASSGWHPAASRREAEGLYSAPPDRQLDVPGFTRKEARRS
jgi:hypothetical protein